MKRMGESLRNKALILANGWRVGCLTTKNGDEWHMGDVNIDTGGSD